MGYCGEAAFSVSTSEATSLYFNISVTKLKINYNFLESAAEPYVPFIF